MISIVNNGKRFLGERNLPYISQERRQALSKGEDLAGPGELNYIITRMLNRYIEHRGLSYQSINDIIGAIECCKLEFVRRVVNNYEDSKIKTNGDVY